MTPVYPFSAIVGHELLRLALVLCAVRPEIGGVLIRGEKGTAKSTAVRGLAAVLAEAGFGRLVELPIGATEDRVIGSLDLQRVLRDGEHAFTPGLLAEAHGGVLYVDEVNLLHDHLVDVLLDAAAMGRVHIERDGVSHSHEARFILVGTMNPEEGELRPQLLDRFGLTVDVRASRDVDERAEVIRRRMAFEDDPAAFARSYAEQDAALARRIAPARAAVGDVVLPDRELRQIASLCAAFGSMGCGPTWWWRAPRSRTPRGGARTPSVKRTSGWRHSWRCRTAAAATRSTSPASTRRSLDEALAQASATTREPEPDPPGGGAPNPQDPQNNSGDASPPPSPPRPSAPPAAPFRTRLLTVPGVGDGAPGRRSRARNRSGAVVRRARHRRLRHPFVRHRAGRRSPGRRAGTACASTPTTCAARSGKAAKRTWSSSSSTRRGRWPPATGWRR